MGIALPDRFAPWRERKEVGTGVERDDPLTIPAVSADLGAMEQFLIGENERPPSPRPPARRESDAGSWRPLVRISVRLASRVDRLDGLRIEEVGFKRTRARRSGWPVEMPPATRPPWLARNSGMPSLPAASDRHSARRQRAAAKPSPISTPLTALMLMQARQLAVELGVQRRAPAGGHTVRDASIDRAERRSGLARIVHQRSQRARGGGIGAEEGIAVDLGIVEQPGRSRRRRCSTR
jgi:hypothetical protein